MLKTLLVAGLIAGVGNVSAVQAAGKTLKFAVFTPAKELTNQTIFVPWAKRVSRDSGGVVDVKVFANGALGRHPGKQIKMIQDGVADVAWVIPAYTPGRFPDNAVFELPNIIQNSREGSVAAYRMYKKGLLRGHDDFYVVGFFVSAPYTIHMKKKITSMDQLKGLKIRAVGPVMVASIKALGAAPEPLPFTKITEAISRGRINGTTAHPIALHDFGIARVTKSHYFGRLGTVPLAVLMNRKVYHGLPAKVRAAIDKNSGESLSIAFGEMSETRNKELHGIWKKDGSRTVTDQSAAEAKAWDAALAPVITEWVKANARNAKLIAALKGTLKNIRAGN